MSFELTEDRLADILDSHPDELEAVVKATFETNDPPIALDSIRAVAQSSGGIFSVESLLFLALNPDDKPEEVRQRFIALLLNKCPDLRGSTDIGDFQRFLDDGDPICVGPVGGFGEPDIDIVHIPRFTEFLQNLGGFRCKVSVAGHTNGSGALVSPRLVLTAGHVIGAMAENEQDNRGELDFADLEGRRIHVIAKDTKPYPARVVWVSRCLQSEETGEVPTSENAKRFCDAALLWLEDPIGREYGHLKLGDAPPEVEGVELFFLVHFPNGADKGLSIGKLIRNAGDTRCCHTVQTAPGSSGGVGFNHSSEFVGIHQGAWPTVRRLVPYSQFSGNESFKEIIEADVPPARLWSLTDTPDGHFIIGRDDYFRALNSILSQNEIRPRGVWIRRSREMRKVGLSFSFDVAAKYLRIREVPHLIKRVQINAETNDLLVRVTERFFGTGESLEAHTGVATDETTGAAHDEDIARQLAERLARLAQETGRSIWLYLEDPGGDLLRDIQLQLEHLAREILLQDDVYLILSGFETYELQVNRVDRLETLQPDARAMFSEYLIHFTLSDVEATLKAATSAMGLQWEDQVIEHEVVQTLAGIDAVNAGTYSGEHLKTVSERLRDRLIAVLGRGAGTP